tara:strand:- start:2543 stop:2692 length:150 start_codon:yes stop_codon:yes gene_type:complete
MGAVFFLVLVGELIEAVSFFSFVIAADSESHRASLNITEGKTQKGMPSF